MNTTVPAKQPAGYFGWSLIDGERGSVMLRDALHNLSSRENGDDHSFGRGVLVGIVSCLMAGGMEFDEACKLAWQHSPKDIHPERVPDCWKTEFGI